MKYIYSIIIAHYNSSKGLDRMLKCIPEREDIQIVVVDDGSNDDEVAQLKELNHNNLEIYYENENHGAGYARNIGLKHVLGKWLLVFDADDMIAENAFDVLDNYKDSDCDYICYGRKCFNEKIQALKKVTVADRALRKYIKNPSRKNLCFFKFLNSNPTNKMVKIEFLRNYNICFEECRVNNDVFYTYQIAIYGKSFIAIDNELYYIVTCSTSIVRKKRSVEREFLFYIQQQKRNGFFKIIGLGYPFYRKDILYILYYIKKHGLVFAIKFYKYRKNHMSNVINAQKDYVNRFKNIDLSNILNNL